MEEKKIRKSSPPEDSEYIAFVNAIEEIDDEIFIEFDCLSFKWAKEFLSNNNFSILQLENGFRSYLITVATNKERFRDIETRNIGDTWVQIMLGSTGIHANYYDENANYAYIPAPVTIKRIKVLDASLLEFTNKVGIADIKEQCSLKKDDIEKLIKKNCSDSGEFVSSYGVGQGSSNAICDKYGMPLMYFDVGGGFGSNWFTYTRTKRFCVSQAKIILLSHWDTDHYESAMRNANERLTKELIWIAPFQNQMGPKNVNFALKLFRANNLKLTSPNFGSFITPYGTIIECTGNDKNNTGFAFEIDLKPQENQIKKVLLPGDAAYCNIPSVINRNKYDAIVATHHGANFSNPNTVPISLNTFNAIVYSYGLGNIWQHPRNITALTDHSLHGWRNRRDVSHWNIGIHNLPLRNHFLCRDNMCDLQLHQSFF